MRHKTGGGEITEGGHVVAARRHEPNDYRKGRRDDNEERHGATRREGLWTEPQVTATTNTERGKIEGLLSSNWASRPCKNYQTTKLPNPLLQKRQFLKIRSAKKVFSINTLLFFAYLTTYTH